MSVVYILDEPQSPEDELAMLKKFHNAERSPKPPSEIVTSKKKRKPTMDQMKNAALQTAYLENGRAAQPVPDESFTSQPPAAQFQATPAAQPIPNESFTAQLPVEDESIPGLTSDSGSDSQSSPESIYNTANEAPLNHYGIHPAVFPFDAEIEPQLEPIDDSNNSLVSPHHAEIDPQLEPIDDSNNSPMSSFNVSSDSLICPLTGIDLGPLHQSNISNTAPSDQAAQLEVGPSLANPVRDDDHVFMFDDEWFLRENHQLAPAPAPASPESAFEDA